MTSTYDVLRDHADLVPFYLARQGAGDANAQRLGAAMDRLLARVGLEGTVAGDARRVLIVQAIGFAAFAGGDHSAPALDQPALRHSFTRALDWLLAGITSTSPSDDALDAVEPWNPQGSRTRSTGPAAGEAR